MRSASVYVLLAWTLPRYFGMVHSLCSICHAGHKQLEDSLSEAIDSMIFRLMVANPFVASVRSSQCHLMCVYSVRYTEFVRDLVGGSDVKG